VVFRFLIRTSKIPERGFKVRVAEQVLNGSCVNTGAVQTASEGFERLALGLFTMSANSGMGVRSVLFLNEKGDSGL